VSTFEVSACEHAHVSTFEVHVSTFEVSACEHF
jgi:hypothetical protein